MFARFGRKPVFFLLLKLSACANTLVWQSGDESVYLLDYGYHSSLVLPDVNEGYWEYAFGEWNWFAHNRSSFWRVPSALMWPTAGTLGRANYVSSKAFKRKVKEVEVEVFVFEVSGEKVSDLLKKLDGKFQSADVDSVVYNPLYGFYFMELPHHRYHFFYNCNHVLIRWLEELGVEVRGLGLFSRWRLKKTTKD